MTLSKEQQSIIEETALGSNIFIDAVIGAGKTTTLHEIALKNQDKSILYLTYNRLLKEDARNKIVLTNTEVQNYHGFVYKYLTANKFAYTNKTGIKEFIYRVERQEIAMPQYDLILIDEYQDINDETSQLIKCIDFYQNKKPQLIFVGDMNQKIYDTTTVDVINDVIFDLRTDYISMDLSSSFRINNEYAKFLSEIWGKKIKGDNHNQKTEIMSYNPKKIASILNTYPNQDILILTPFRNNISLNEFINYLEKSYPEKYDKTNLYTTITRESNTPVEGSMIVTTFDGSKGMERPIVLVFGWDESTLRWRSQKGNKNIIKNLYMVAASRGKERIIFIDEHKNELLNTKNFERNLLDRAPSNSFLVHEMYDFVYDTELNKLYDLLEITQIPTEDQSEIYAKQTDYNIQLSPAIYFYQQAIYFKNWDYNKVLEKYNTESPIYNYISKIKTTNKKKQVLLLTALVTNLTRYANQATTDFMTDEDEIRLTDRLRENFSPYEDINIKINKRYNGIEIMGMVDVYQNSTSWQIEFTEELEKKHFLQTATLGLMLDNNEFSVVWNTKYNKLYQVEIKDKERFVLQMLKTIQKK